MEENRLIFSPVFIHKLQDLVDESESTGIRQVDGPEHFLLGPFDPTPIRFQRKWWAEILWKKEMIFF